MRHAWERIGTGAEAELGAPHHHAREERASTPSTRPNRTLDPTAMPSHDQHREREELARAARAQLAPAATEPRARRSRNVTATSGRSSAAAVPSASGTPWLSPALKSAGKTTRTTTVKRSSTHEPPHRNAAGGGCELVVIGERTRVSTTVLATDSRQTVARHRRPNSSRMPTRLALSAVAKRLCTTAPGSAIRRTREQVVDVEMQPDAEHQQHNANGRHVVVGEVLIRDEAWRVRPDHDARQQITDDGR